MYSFGYSCLLFMAEIRSSRVSPLFSLKQTAVHLIACLYFNTTTSLAFCSRVVMLKGGYRALQVTSFHLSACLLSLRFLTAYSNLIVEVCRSIQSNACFFCLSVHMNIPRFFRRACMWGHSRTSVIPSKFWVTFAQYVFFARRVRDYMTLSACVLVWSYKT